MILSVPSYVIPGTYAENLRFLADKPDVRGVELLFYFWDDETRRLLDRESKEIRSFDGRFRFTAHLPDRVGPEHRVVLEATEAFARSWVVHPPRETSEIPAFAGLVDEWRSRFGDRFFLENVRLPTFEAARRTLPDIPLCVDAGHLMMGGKDPASFVADLLAEGRRVEEIHLHGLSGGKDHRPFVRGAAWLRDLAPFLRSFEGVAEIELFAWDEAAEALDAIRAVTGESAEATEATVPVRLPARGTGKETA